MKRALLLLATLLATPALAVLNDTGNGNTTAPVPAEEDPGFLNVGGIGGLDGVYMGYGWVLTAAHVGLGSGNTRFDGVNYAIVTSTAVVFMHDATTQVDLKAFKIDPYPSHLPVIEIAPVSPPMDTKVVMIGSGRDRGDPETWGLGGWKWAASGSHRWGTNQIGGTVAGGPPFPVAEILVSIGSRLSQSLVVEFNKNVPVQDSPHECHVTTGDSGGGLFVETFEGSGEWELAGIHFALTEHAGQPAQTAIYDNDTLAVDLAHYRAQVLEVIRPCDDGVDNDLDTLMDYPEDPDCAWIGDDSELPQCSDGLDNDYDGDADFPADSDCTSAADLFEDLDLDGDFVADDEDNCLGLANPIQLDTNLDGYGNLCDSDFTNDGLVASPDFAVLVLAFGAAPGEPEYDPDVDADGDGVISSPEFSQLSIQFENGPGPSGLACAGTVPCP